MNFKTKLLDFLNREKQEITQKITESFEKQKDATLQRQDELRFRFLEGMEPKAFLVSMRNCADLEIKKQKQRSYQKFLDEGGDKNAFNSDLSDLRLRSAILEETSKINNLICFVESDYYEDSCSILDKFEQLEVAEVKLSYIREQFEE